MTIRYRIVFSLTLTVVFAVPRTAGAQFDLDRQATEIATQVQEILNRITQYTTQITQYTSLDCSAQGMAAGAEATPVGQLPVVCDTLGMLGSFRDSYQQLLAAPADLLHTAPPLPDWRDVLQAADTVTEADIRNIYQNGADNAVGAFGRQREYADRGLVLAHAESDAVAALTDTLDEADAAVADLEARSSVTRTGMGQTDLAATLTRARLAAAVAQVRARQASAQAADVYIAETARRELEARRLAERAALEAQWAQDRAALAAGAAQRIESMYGGYRLPAVFSGN